jgi:hypothetical protein
MMTISSDSILKNATERDRRCRPKERNFISAFELMISEIVFWNIAPYSLLDTDRRFGGTVCIYHNGDDRDSKVL